MNHHIQVACEVRPSGRVTQVGALFDLLVEHQHHATWDVDLPLEDRPWQVGLVVGPSGSGKTQLARHVWPDQLARPVDWPTDRALVDCFPPDASIKDITGLLCAVGLGSTPTWVRPFHTLSNGEAFRASLARALADTDGLLVVDEFTSVVDRQVAKVASHALQKAVRRSGRQVIAVTCHYDVLDWLQPDWVYDTAGHQFTWRSLRPHPPVELQIYPVDRAVWPLFRQHHYLSGNLANSAHCFGAFLDGQIVAFSAYLHLPHRQTRNIKMGHRLVVLPDYQGWGIGGRFDDWLGQYLYERGFR